MFLIFFWLPGLLELSHAALGGLLSAMPLPFFFHTLSLTIFRPFRAFPQSRYFEEETGVRCYTTTTIKVTIIFVVIYLDNDYNKHMVNILVNVFILRWFYYFNQVKYSN